MLSIARRSATAGIGPRKPCLSTISVLYASPKTHSGSRPQVLLAHDRHHLANARLDEAGHPLQRKAGRKILGQYLPKMVGRRVQVLGDDDVERPLAVALVAQAKPARASAAPPAAPAGPRPWRRRRHRPVRAPTASRSRPSTPRTFSIQTVSSSRPSRLTIEAVAVLRVQRGEDGFVDVDKDDFIAARQRVGQ